MGQGIKICLGLPPGGIRRGSAGLLFRASTMADAGSRRGPMDRFTSLACAHKILKCYSPMIPEVGNEQILRRHGSRFRLWIVCPRRTIIDQRLNPFSFKPHWPSHDSSQDAQELSDILNVFQSRI